MKVLLIPVSIINITASLIKVDHPLLVIRDLLHEKVDIIVIVKCEIIKMNTVEIKKVESITIGLTQTLLGNIVMKNIDQMINVQMIMIIIIVVDTESVTESPNHQQNPHQFHQ